MHEEQPKVPRPRLRTAVLVVALVGGLVAMAGCGQEDVDGPSAPDVSRAQPTGTVDTTVPE
jgi:hypothetical protein